MLLKGPEICSPDGVEFIIDLDSWNSHVARISRLYDGKKDLATCGDGFFERHPPTCMLSDFSVVVGVVMLGTVHSEDRAMGL